MKLKLHRKYIKNDYTIGDLYLVENGKDIWLCNTLEDKVRDLNKNGRFDNGETKVMHKTAIPYGTYNITLDVVSPKFCKYPFYKAVCNGKLPRLLNVPHFEGILIHCAEGDKGAELLSGCIGVGLNTIKGGLTKSKDNFRIVYSLLLHAKSMNEELNIEIV